MARSQARNNVRLLAVVACLFVSSSAAAQSFPETMETPRGLAMGSGARASAVSTSALAYNPANLALARVYHVEATTGYSPTYDSLALGSSVVDSVTSRLAMGMNIRGLVGVADGGYGGFDGRVTLAMNIVEALGIGISARYVRLEYKGTPPPGQRDAFLNAFTMDASLRLTFTEGFHLAVLAQNLVPTHNAYAPLMFGGSLSYTIAEAFTISADGLADLSPRTAGTPFTVGGGVEYLAGGVVPIRAGYYFDDSRTAHVVSGGLGYVDQHLGVDLAFRQQIEPSAATTLLLGVRYFVR